MSNDPFDVFAPAIVADLFDASPCYVVVHVGGCAGLRFGPMSLDAALDASEQCEALGGKIVLVCEPGEFDGRMASAFIKAAKKITADKEAEVGDGT